LRSSQRGGRTRNASCTPGLVQARARRACAPQLLISGRAICLFLPFRTPRRARQRPRLCRRVLMARGGLEPPTPRFSDVRSTASNGIAIPGKQRVLGRWTQRLKPRSLRSFAADSGDEVRLVSRSRRCSAADRCVRSFLTGPKWAWYRLSESATTGHLYGARSNRPLMIPRRPTGAHTRGPANDVACQCRGGGIRRDRWRHRKTGSVAAAARHAGAQPNRCSSPLIRRGRGDPAHARPTMRPLPRSSPSRWPTTLTIVRSQGA
jgi:hypothetical protein